MKRWSIILLLMAGMLMAACNRRPSYVMSTNKMSNVMADIHMAEAVLDMSPQHYNNDSVKMLLKQSVLARHNVTLEQFDTSLVWYGHHMNKYLEVMDKEIALLEKREEMEGARAREASLSLAGDSVDVWAGSRYVAISNRYPSRAVPFSLSVDENCEPGDQYTWRIKVVEGEQPMINWTLVAHYSDSTIEYLNSATNAHGWNEITFMTDSTKTLTNLRGQFLPGKDERLTTICIDSIQLVRKRVNQEKYHTRYRQRAAHEYM